jgi:GTPase SAR1 family protein
MGERVKRATLSKGRAGWCVIFRHPVCKAPNGQALRIRRGLNTRVEAEAQELVAQANELLGDEAWWSLSRRDEAARRFNERIVKAFYDDMVPSERDTWNDREAALPLPGGRDAHDGYARLLMVGTTGSGKTTLVRQLLGTDPKTERFPSTSAAKTTVSDLEIVLDDGPFRGVVTFFERHLVRQCIADCVSAAVASAAEGLPERDTWRRLLEHADQRFRLSYVLGTFDDRAISDDLEDDEDQDFDEFIAPDEDAVGDEERRELRERLDGYFARILAVSKEYRSRLAAEAERQRIDLANAPRADRERLEEAIEDEITRDEAFDSLVDDILDDCEARFERLDSGEMSRGRDGWPTSWSFESRDRAKFISTINRFSSNYAPHFGRLLTPFVEGMRVAGPFHPAWHAGERPKLVIFDGQGLGHTADTVSSVSTRVTRRYEMCDAILVVDNAEQPMQAATCSAIESLVSSGHESKMILCLTHFDGVKADNLIGFDARQNHVLGSFENVIANIAKTHGRYADRSLRAAMPDRTIFLADIHKPLGIGAKRTRKELHRLLGAIAGAIVPPEPVVYEPEYDVANLVLAIQMAAAEFHDRWRGVLSMGSRSGVAPEHWTRIKALARRLGFFKTDEYDSLRPVADLIRILQTHLSQFLAQPVRWHPSTPAEVEETHVAAIDLIRKEMFTRLHHLSRRRILEECVSGWAEAYQYRGEGSTKRRARSIIDLYSTAAPVPNEMPGPDANEFLNEMRALAVEAVESGGGKLKGWSREEVESTL